MDNIILSLTQRQRENKVCCNNKLWGQTQNAIKMIETTEDWKDDSNGRVT
jgi:hypothetical protein